MESTADPTDIRLNPWLSMWTQPRDTIRRIVEDDPERYVLLLAALSGIGSALDRASMKSLGDVWPLPFMLLVVAIGGTLSGIVGLYIGAALIRWTGRWIGGTGAAEEIRAAMAWSGVPLVWALLLWVPLLALFGQELFMEETPLMDSSLPAALLLIAIGIIELVLGIWAFVLFLKALGEVQGFSAWRALGNGALAVAVIVVPLMLLALPFILS